MTTRRVATLLAGACLAIASATVLAQAHLDPAFGTAGIATLPGPGLGGQVSGLVVHADGGMFVTGTQTIGFISGGAIGRQFTAAVDARGAVERLSTTNEGEDFRPKPVRLRNGDVLTAPDPAHAGGILRVARDGTAVEPYSSNSVVALGARFGAAVEGFAEQPDGRVVVLVAEFTPGGLRLAFRRLAVDGTLDPSFPAGSGWPMPAGVRSDDPLGLLLAPDGKLLVASNAVPADLTPSTPAVLRFNADGSPDTTFGIGGRADVARTADVRDLVVGIAAAPDGVLLAELVSDGILQANALVVRRLDATGHADLSFGTQGVVRMPSAGPADDDGFLQVLADGSALVVARFDGTTYQLRKLTPAGAPDWTFGADAWVIPVALASVREMALTPDDAVVLAGFAPPAPGAPAPGNIVLARYTGLRVAAVEFHDAVLDHYFVSTNPLEVADLDLGFHGGWARTGATFHAFASADAGAAYGFVPVCRFYIPPGLGDSHFLSASSGECAAVERLRATDPRYAGYVEESAAAFYIGLPDPVTGACAPGTVPVYRLWNQRADSNHRYTTSPATRRQMVDRGYVAEGYGPDAVALCALQ